MHKSYSPRRKPVVLAGDYNVIPTEIDVYKPNTGLRMRSSCPSTGGIRQSRCDGLDRTRCAHYSPDKRIYTFGITSETIGCAMLVCASIICF